MPRYANLTIGDPGPWFTQHSYANPKFAFDTAAGRYIVLCFYGSAAAAHSQAALKAALTHRHLFDDVRACFFGVSLDPKDEVDKRVVNVYPGYRFFWDFDGKISRLYGAASLESEQAVDSYTLRRMWIVLDPTLRVLKVFPFADDQSDITAVLGYVAGLPPAARFVGFDLPAPVIVLPNVFEPEFCKRLIDLYEAHGGAESGFMREVDGNTVGMHEHRLKRRKDCKIEDPAMIKETRVRFERRVVPEIKKVHQFAVTRMERYIVACYAAEDQAHFVPHRDNTTKGTAHRQFAVSVNLNQDFDGGEVHFPEYGPRGLKAPIGGAVIFSCSLLHSVSRVTRGRRYAFLPFLYNEEAATLRKTNMSYLAGEVPFQAGPSSSPKTTGG
jgi:predicted 2-oxoglutarate/Fe(II)-dependent dioxygenase YbiX/peroxiredoxin